MYHDEKRYFDYFDMEIEIIGFPLRFWYGLAPCVSVSARNSMLGLPKQSGRNHGFLADRDENWCRAGPDIVIEHIKFLRWRSAPFSL